MSKYRIFHSLIVLAYLACLVYGLSLRNTQGFILIVAAAIIGIILILINHKINHPKRQKR